MATIGPNRGNETVLHPGTGDMGDTVYVLDLAPIYKKIGRQPCCCIAGNL